MIERICRSWQALSLTAALNTSPPINFEGFSGGMIGIPAGSPITSLTWYSAPAITTNESADTQPGTFLPANNSAGTATVQTVVAGKAYQIPVELFGAAYVACVVNSAGPVDITLKT